MGLNSLIIHPVLTPTINRLLYPRATLAIKSLSIIKESSFSSSSAQESKQEKWAKPANDNANVAIELNQIAPLC